MLAESEMLDELLKRYDGRHKWIRSVKSFLKVFVWKATIGFAYCLKRGIDIVGAVAGMVLLLPFFGGTAIAIFIEDGRPVFFVQKRIGKYGREFDFYKFRSMVKNAESLKKNLGSKNESGDGVIFKMKSDPRILKFGKIIRKLSIDELPQLYNVLKGDMSLVGPRPPLPCEVSEYSLEQRKRLDVLPGITCIWQVSGRSEIPFKEQVKLDIEYIKSSSVLIDVKLLFMTIPAVLLGRGGY